MANERESVQIQLEKLDLKPGDILIIKCFNKIDEEHIKRIKEYFSKALQPGVTKIVIDAWSFNIQVARSKQ